MTLVLAYANTDFVTVAVDRRVTVGKSMYDEKRTKTLAWGNELIVAFTGLAEIGADRQHTMRWLSETIARHGVFDTELIVPELSAAVDAAPFQPEDKRLALVAVGYIGGRIVYMLISNMHSDSGDLLDSPRCDYWVCVDQPEVRSTVRTVGQQMPSKAGPELLARILQQGERPGRGRGAETSG